MQHSAATRTGSAAPTTTVTSSPLDALSSELVKVVASLADIKTVGRFGCTSKQLRDICSAVLGSPAYMRSVQSVLATHVIVLKDGPEFGLPEAVDASANPGPYTVRTTLTAARPATHSLAGDPRAIGQAVVLAGYSFIAHTNTCSCHAGANGQCFS